MPVSTPGVDKPVRFNLAAQNHRRLDENRSIRQRCDHAGESLPTRLLSVPAAGRSADDLAHALRIGKTSVVCRIEHDELRFDPRTVDPREDDSLAAAIRAVTGVQSSP